MSLFLLILLAGTLLGLIPDKDLAALCLITLFLIGVTSWYAFPDSSLTAALRVFLGVASTP